MRCHDTVEGAQCDPCPVGLSGDGRSCTPLNGCHDDPCPQGTKINYPGFLSRYDNNNNKNKKKKPKK